MSKGGTSRFFSPGLLLIVAIFGVGCFTTPLAAAAPQTISFQGRVLSKDRTQAPTGSYAFRFSLYNSQSGGSAAWQESWSSLPVRYGLFSVDLGTSNPLAGLDWTNSSYWLGIEFDSDRNGTLDQAFTGRVPLTAAPFAFSAQTLTETLSISKGGTGATTSAGALINILPSQSGQSGKALVSDGTNASWQNISGGVTDASYLTLGASSGLSGERTLQGTANQVYLSDGGANGSVTLYLPQDISTTSNLQFRSLALSGTGAGSDLIFGGDTNLYRSAANVLKTDDRFHALTGLMAGDSSSTDTNSLAFFYENYSGSTDYYGLISRVINSGTGSSIGVLGSSYIVNVDAGGDGIGVQGQVIGSANDGSSITNAKSFYSKNTMGFVPATNSYGLYADNPTGSAITNSYGIFIADQTIGTTSDYGLVIAGADTQALWVSSGADNTDAANGIAFGASRDTNLYRSAADSLKTDDQLIVGGATTSLAAGFGLGVSGHTILNSSGTSGVSLYMDATGHSGVQYRLISTGSTASWGGQFSGAGKFAITDGSQPFLWIDAGSDKIVINSDLEIIDNAKLMAQGDLRLYDSDSTNYVGFQSSGTVASDLIWTLPSSDSSGCLASNGSGVMSWSACAGGSGAPTGAQYLTLALDSSLSAERVLAGTTNQVILTDGGANGNLTLSLPQSIHTAATPQFAKLGLGQAANSYLLSLPAATAAVGGIDFGGDTNLYRGAANELQTDDMVTFGSTKTTTTTDFKTYKADGGVGFIFDTSSTYSTGSLLSIRNNGGAKLALSNSGNLVIAGTLTQNGTPADIAENIQVSDSSIGAGDIVSADENHDATVRKAIGADSRVLGVISTNPGILISGGTDGRPLALAGRIPVKVKADANLKRGDLVVISDTAGKGTKAGATAAASVGVALTDQTSHNTVTVQLQPGYYIPSFGNTQSDLALSPQQTGVLSAMSLLDDGTLKISSLTVDRLAVATDLAVSGNLRVSGRATLGGIALPSLESATSTIAAGQTAYFVNTTKVTSTDRIIITPVNESGSDADAIITRGLIKPEEGFWVHLNAARSSDLKFDWLLIH